MIWREPLTPHFCWINKLCRCRLTPWEPWALANLTTLLCTYPWLDPSLLNEDALDGTDLQGLSALPPPHSSHTHSRCLLEISCPVNPRIKFASFTSPYLKPVAELPDATCILSELITLQLMAEICISSQGHQLAICTIKIHSASVMLVLKVIQVFLHHIVIPFHINDASHFCIISKFH